MLVRRYCQPPPDEAGIVQVIGAHIAEVFSDPQVLSREKVVELGHPTQGKAKLTGIAIKLAETPGSIRSFAPRYGEHTNEVSLGLGYTKEKIEALRHMGVISY